MRAAIVRDGLVENVVEYDPDGDWAAPVGTDAIPLDGDRAGPGWTYDGTEFTPPAAAAESPPTLEQRVAALEARADRAAAANVTGDAATLRDALKPA